MKSCLGERVDFALFEVGHLLTSVVFSLFLAPLLIVYFEALRAYITLGRLPRFGSPDPKDVELIASPFGWIMLLMWPLLALLTASHFCLLRRLSVKNRLVCGLLSLPVELTLIWVILQADPFALIEWWAD